MAPISLEFLHAEVTSLATSVKQLHNDVQEILIRRQTAGKFFRAVQGVTTAAVIAIAAWGFNMNSRVSSIEITRMSRDEIRTQDEALRHEIMNVAGLAGSLSRIEVKMDQVSEKQDALKERVIKLEQKIDR